MQGDLTRAMNGSAGVPARVVETLGRLVSGRRDAVLFALLGAQIAGFAAAALSGNIPEAAIVIFRALLTL